MPATDPIADFLTRLRNASMVNKGIVTAPHSRVVLDLAKVLAKEGFIGEVDTRGSGVHKEIVVQMRYINEQSAFENVERISKPGRRVYCQAKNLRPVKSGFGVAVLSTPKGVLTDKDAKSQRVGGEIMCTIW
jgi:small subunit ribosomal protein S8